MNPKHLIHNVRLRELPELPELPAQARRCMLAGLEHMDLTDKPELTVYMSELLANGPLVAVATVSVCVFVSILTEVCLVLPSLGPVVQ